MFKPVNSRVDFVALETSTLAWWEENGIPLKYRERNAGEAKKFSFIDGPITANNPMGVHHAWGRTYKDLFQRYKTMQGYRQRYQNGFDGQGLWIEVEVEKELGLNSKREIETFGIDKFVELCKARVRKFADVQTRQSIRLGYWMDWDNSYHTMSDENNYTIWHFLKVCHERGWIYEGTDVMPWCPRCGTGLSQHEIVTEGYKEIVHPGLFLRLPLLDREGEALLVWTTTPWTLTGNTGVYLHPDLTYVKVRSEGEVLYLLKSRLSVVKGDVEVLEEMPGKDLAGLRYKGPFDDLPVQEGVEHRVVLLEDVDETEGTGIVHTAPGAGQIDFELSKTAGLDVIAPLDEFGKFVEGFGWLTGESVSDVNERIYDSLREKGLFYRVEDYSHRYPVCWRCDTELVFRLVDEWFISMDELRHKIAEVTTKIDWVPSFGMERELDWLRNMHDWMISKKRYWGLALPIYKCHECGHFDVMGSEDELKERATQGWEEFDGQSPHRPWIDAVKIACAECGATVERIKDVGNPWLDAGIVPFSTIGYRKDRAKWEEWFPADWISESFPGQFRNWFYSLLTMGTVLENTEAFRSIFSYALMRDEKGEEMHKSKGNAIWFEDAAEEMGVDAMRWVFALQNPAANMSFGSGVVEEARRRFLIPLWNVYSFFVTYANIDGYDPRAEAPPVRERPELDRWIVSELNVLVAEVTAALDKYEPDAAAHALEGFVELLTNWYVRRSRRRFWKSDQDDDKRSAYSTLYECLTTVTRLLAPIVPFVTEEMHGNLVASLDGAESVHLESWPVADIGLVDERLGEATRLAMRLSSLGRAARSKAGLKVRQPLAVASFKLRSAGEQELFDAIAQQVKEELNVKTVKVLTDEADVVELAVRPDMSTVGPKYGAKSRDVASALGSAEAAVVAAAVAAGEVVHVGEFELSPDEVMVLRSDREGYSSASEAGYTAAVGTEISPELKAEGTARELVHILQNMRRSADFDIADHIVAYYQGPAEIEDVFRAHGEYIRQETLSDELINEGAREGALVETHKVNGQETLLGVVRSD